MRFGYLRVDLDHVRTEPRPGAIGLGVVLRLSLVSGVSSSLLRAASQIWAAISWVSRAASWKGLVEGVEFARRPSASSSLAIHSFMFAADIRWYSSRWTVTSRVRPSMS